MANYLIFSLKIQLKMQKRNEYVSLAKSGEDSTILSNYSFSQLFYDIPAALAAAFLQFVFSMSYSAGKNIFLLQLLSISILPKEYFLALEMVLYLELGL
jgi:hypothetical protein